MPQYEVIRLYFDPGDLAKLNSLGSAGFAIVAVLDRSQDQHFDGPLLAILQRDRGLVA